MDPLVVIDDRGGRHLVRLDEPMVQIPRLGVIESGRLREHLGRKLTVGTRAVMVLPASRRDLMEGLDRLPQTIGPKDAAAIIFFADVGPGTTVVEAGTGSGWLTVALASAVGSGGRVISYERREDFATLARENLGRAGLGDRVEIRLADVRTGIPERAIDAVIVDLPDPWNVAGAAWDALAVGGSFASFSPTVEQVRLTAESLRARPFIDVRTMEVIQRELEVRTTGTRPSQAPLGHTGYLTLGRKVLETW